MQMVKGLNMGVISGILGDIRLNVISVAYGNVFSFIFGNIFRK